MLSLRFAINAKQVRHKIAAFLPFVLYDLPAFLFFFSHSYSRSYSPSCRYSLGAYVRKLSPHLAHYSINFNKTKTPGAICNVLSSNVSDIHSSFSPNLSFSLRC